MPGGCVHLTQPSSKPETYEAVRGYEVIMYMYMYPVKLAHDV